MSNFEQKRAQHLHQLNSSPDKLLAESEESLAQLEELVSETKRLRALSKARRRAPIIHVVDDDESFQTAILRLLRAAGYEARGYTNATDFLLAQPEQRPGCILMDFVMPGPSGLDLQRTLTMRAEPLPIIFMSGYGDADASLRAMQSGAAAFLIKPIERDALLAAIKSALARYDREHISRGSSRSDARATNY
jgi:FixJ family two-component response regulator